MYKLLLTNITLLTTQVEKLQKTTKCAKLRGYTHENVNKLAIIDKLINYRVYKKTILTDSCGKLRTTLNSSFNRRVEKAKSPFCFCK